MKPQKPSILFESDSFVAVDKPAGWLSIPGRSALPVIYEWAQAEKGKLWVVHRLDRDTSGVLLFARNEEAHRTANTWFEKHLVKKNYDFLASGNPRAPIFKSSEPIKGAPSTTQFEVREKWNDGFFLGRAWPTTGRRHQIRIHLAKLGFPILGDSGYGGVSKKNALDFSRVALHASLLTLPTGEKIEAPWHADFENWVSALRGAA